MRTIKKSYSSKLAIVLFLGSVIRYIESISHRYALICEEILHRLWCQESPHQILIWYCLNLLITWPAFIKEVREGITRDSPYMPRGAFRLIILKKILPSDIIKAIHRINVSQGWYPLFFRLKVASCVILSPSYNFQILWCSCLPCDAFHLFCEVCGLPCEVLHPVHLSVVTLISCPPWESHSRWLGIGLISLYSPLWHPRPIMLSTGLLFFVYTPLAFRDCGDLSL